MTKTYSPKPTEIQRAWHVVDATDVALGRLSSEVARLLIGKHKANYAPHMDTGDFVIVVNAEKVKLTGHKNDDKIYYRHSGRPGGLKQRTAAELREKYPERIVEKAVKGMLPKNRLGRKLFTKLNVYGGAEHPHEAQQPTPLTIDFKRVRKVS